FCSALRRYWVLPIAATARSLFSGAELYKDSVSSVSLYIYGFVKGMTLNQFYFFDKSDQYSVAFFPYWPLYQAVSIPIIMLIIIFCISIVSKYWYTIDKKGKLDILHATALFGSGVFFSKGNAHPFGEIFVWMLTH